MKIEDTKMVRELLDYAKINDTFCLTTTQFREFENEVEEACEKQIAKKPNMYRSETFGSKYPECECGKSVMSCYGDRYPSCPYCGNKMDWSEEECI